MARSATSLAAVLLSQRLVDGPAAPLKAADYWRVLASVDHDPGRLLGLPAVEVAATAGVDTELAGRIAALLDQATAVAVAVDDLEQSGLRVLASVDDDYPSSLHKRLGPAAPPLLYVAGPPSLLASDLLGVVGSRTVEPAGADVARRAAGVAVEAGLGVVSGGANGVDEVAMRAALDAGGAAVAVLADSLMRQLRDPDVRRAVGQERLCLATPYKPTAGFSVASAMGRNKLIYALARTTLVVAADHDRGGTWAGAVEALGKRSAPVLVWTGDGAGPGNQALVDNGGVPVREVGPAMFDVTTPPPPGESPEQMAMGW